MTITVCVGSTCHKHGSYTVLNRLSALCRQHGVADRVTVVPAFCLGQCAAGISVKVDDRLITGVSETGADALFEQYVLPALNT